MSFGLPSVKPRPELKTSFKQSVGQFGIPDPLVSGTNRSKGKLGFIHPLQDTEANYLLNEDKKSMAILRNVQGLHAPLKLAMERKAASQVGRLPFLPSSNLMSDVLTGRYLDIGFEDILGLPEFSEYNLQPHAVVERSLGML